MDIERWKPIPGFTGYEISDQGRIRSYKKRTRNKGWHISSKSQRIIRQSITNGYPFVILMSDDRKRTNRRVHTLVMLAFVGPCPKGKNVCHNNGIKDDNRLENLRYDTPQGNANDFLDSNGGVSPRASITLKKAKEIKEYLSNHTIPETSKEFDVDIGSIGRISSGHSYVALKDIKSRMDWKQERADKIRELYAIGKYTYEQLSEQFNLSISGISRIINRQRMSNEESSYPYRDKIRTSKKKIITVGAKLTLIENKALENILNKEQLGKGEALRFIIRHYAKLYNLWPLTCPDCDSTTIDHIGGDNYRCEKCGLHFAVSREKK